MGGGTQGDGIASDTYVQAHSSGMCESLTELNPNRPVWGDNDLRYRPRELMTGEWPWRRTPVDRAVGEFGLGPAAQLRAAKGNGHSFIAVA